MASNIFPTKVKIVEVGPRDGLQNEKQPVATANKVEFINLLSASGLPVIEVTSFVSPKWVPQLADAKDVFQTIDKKSDVSYSVLIPNLQGLEAALTVDVKEIAIFTTPSEQFAEHNTHCSVAESIERITAVVSKAKQQQLRVRGYISCVLGCPYEGDVAIAKVAKLANTLITIGCDEISLGDTIGVGTPLKTQQLIKTVSETIPVSKLAVHFHDTYGQALTNIYAALECGVAIVDSAVAGLGGCPYAQGASGNVATEDVLYLLHGMGIATGVDLTKVSAAGQYICEQLQRPSQSKVSLANKK